MGLWLALIGRAAVDTVTTVTIPVAFLLWLLAWLEASGRLNPHRFLAGSGWRQTVYGASLAAIPGCAGGIAVSKMYVEGFVAPAALWAAHIATAGDASFVLLVGRPLTAIGIFAFLFVLGSVTGIVMASRRRRAEADAVAPVVGAQAGADAVEEEEDEEGAGVPRLYTLWIAFTVAAVLAAIVANAAGAVVNAVAGVLAFAAVMVSIGIQQGWQLGRPAPALEPAVALTGEVAAAGDVGIAAGVAGGPVPGPAGGGGSGPIRRGREVVDSAIRTAVKDASEITLWVAVADLAFFAVQQIWGPQVKVWMNGAVLPVTLIAVVVGMIPGCGPQIFLARLFTAGSLPFPAILANSVSQHGDSLFPLLGRRRNQAVRVTFSSTILALAVGLIAVAVMTKL